MEGSLLLAEPPEAHGGGWARVVDAVAWLDRMVAGAEEGCVVVRRSGRRSDAEAREAESLKSAHLFGEDFAELRAAWKQGWEEKTMANEVDFPAHLTSANLLRKEVSEYLELIHGIKLVPSAPARMAVTGGWPPFDKPGLRSVYPRAELDAWANQRLGPLKAPTSSIL